jgi:hypothetical protein
MVRELSSVHRQLCRIHGPRQVPRLQCYNAGTLSTAIAEDVMGVDLLNIKGLRELEHQGPIVMVNLMRFHDRSLDGNGSGWMPICATAR